MVGVDVVGCDESDQGRSCSSHPVCGQHVLVGDIVTFRPEVAVDEDSNICSTVKVFVVRQGAATCCIGFLPRRLLLRSGEFLFKYAVIAEDVRGSSNMQKRRRSTRNKGLLYCRLINGVPV